jgi:hypothetical protein
MVGVPVTGVLVTFTLGERVGVNETGDSEVGKYPGWIGLQLARKSINVQEETSKFFTFALLYIIVTLVFFTRLQEKNRRCLARGFLFG